MRYGIAHESQRCQQNHGHIKIGKWHFSVTHWTSHCCSTYNKKRNINVAETLPQAHISNEPGLEMLYCNLLQFSSLIIGITTLHHKPTMCHTLVSQLHGYEELQNNAHFYCFYFRTSCNKCIFLLYSYQNHMNRNVIVPFQHSRWFLQNLLQVKVTWKL